MMMTNRHVHLSLLQSDIKGITKHTVGLVSLLCLLDGESCMVLQLMLWLRTLSDSLKQLKL